MSGHRLISIEDTVSMLRRGDLRPSDVMSETLEAIAALNPTINALTQVWGDEAMERANQADANPSALGTLAGMPSADKDLVHRAGHPTRFGSAASAGWAIPNHSDPMATWLDRSGALSVGKSATSEFGLAGYTETSAFGPTRNPHDTSRGVGGSSGGAAAAVASGLLPFAPGSDGGGSIRIPALACGVVGLKPSRGRVPFQPGIETLSGFVVPGIIARTVADVSYVSDILFDGDYRWSVMAPPLPRALTESVKNGVGPLRIGVTTVTPWGEAIDCDLDPEAVSALELAVSALRDAGHRVETWDWTPLRGYFDAFSTMWQASTTGLELSDQERSTVEPLTRFLVERGREVRGDSLVSTVAWLRQFEHDTINQMAPFDVILTPGLAMPPPPIGFFDERDAEKNFIQQIQFTPYTSFVNVCGLPALALPTHYTDGDLPMGVQLIGPPGREDTLVAVGWQLESRVGPKKLPGVWAGQRGSA